MPKLVITQSAQRDIQIAREQIEDCYREFFGDRRTYEELARFADEL